MLGIQHSTARNLLSGAYMKLGVHNKAAAITEAQRRGLVPTRIEPDLKSLGG